MTKKYHSIPEEWIAQVLEDYNKLYQGDNESALYVLNRIKEYFPAVEDKHQPIDVLTWLENQDTIVLIEKNWYFEDDKDGDQPLTSQQILNLFNLRNPS